MQRQESYKGFEIIWQEPPMTAIGRTLNIASNNQELQARLEAYKGSAGAYVIQLPPDVQVDGVLDTAQKYIDVVLG